MSNVPDVLKPQYYFDMELLGFSELFENVNFVWEAVKEMQGGSTVDGIVRAQCASDHYTDAPYQNVSGNVEVRISPEAKVGANVFISGNDGGLVFIDDGADVRPGTMILTGSNAVYIGKGAKVGPNAHIDATKGSCSVGDKATLRQGAYLRELSVIAAKATIGNSCEIKCALIGPEAEVPHFNYVGDSILGYKAHMGAGVKISNLKITPDPKKVNSVKVRYDNETFDTGMRKFGVILGDKAQMGCNSVANPGTFVGKMCLIYGNSSVVGLIPERAIIKLRQTHEKGELQLS